MIIQENENEVQKPTTLKLKRTLQGKVVSDKMDKTVVVLITRRVKDARYGKYVVKSKKYHAHDEANQYNTGDIVEITETRPISKTKTWSVSRLIEANRE
jgi:small subunit ribosomal protein S17